MNTGIERIVIVGGGLAGWTAACAFANALRGLRVQITVIELPGRLNIEPTQFTLPATLDIFRHLGIDEDELVRRAAATFRLGTLIEDWPSASGTRVRAYGSAGGMIGFIPFHHYAVKRRLAGEPSPFSDWSPGAMALQAGRFGRGDSEAGRPPLPYGMQLNTDKLIELLRANATLNGVEVIAQDIDVVDLAGDSGSIDSLRLNDTRRIAADLFVDASGEAAVLAGAALEIDFIDWSHWLPCNRTASITVRHNADKIPALRLQNGEQGWIIESLLQHRLARQLVFAADQTDDAAAADILTRGLPTEDADALTFGDSKSGRRRRFWSGNCLLLGTAAGHVENLEVSGLHLVQSAVLRFLQHFPATLPQPRLAEEYNRRTAAEFDAWRDFVLLHYVAAREHGSGFAARASTAEWPDSLAARLELFSSRGRFLASDDDGPGRDLWIAALLAGDLWPRGYDPLLDAMDEAELATHFANVRHSIGAAVQSLPPQRDYLRGLSA